MERSWVVVVPVKRLDVAKSRLAPRLGRHRRALALAMALDTIGVAASCPGVRVVVVTDDETVAAALTPDELASGGEIKVQLVADEPRAGINAALAHGALSAGLRPTEGVAALAADLPSLRAAELGLALGRASAAGSEQSFVPDAAGTGTTLYAAASLDSFQPRFGPGSAAAYAAVAVALSTHGLDSLQRDVDTIDDLHAAVDLGLHERTAHVVARLPGLELSAVQPAS